MRRDRNQHLFECRMPVRFPLDGFIGLHFFLAGLEGAHERLNHYFRHTQQERSRGSTQGHLNAEIHKLRSLGGALHKARKTLTTEDGGEQGLFVTPLIEPFFENLPHHVVEQGALNFGEFTLDGLGHPRTS